jgi:alpha-mannosidase
MDQIAEIKPGFTKRDPIAWFCTHRHDAEAGDEPYQFSYLFKYGLDLPAGASNLTLPENPKIKILAITLANNSNEAVRAAQLLYDDFTGRQPIRLRPQPISTSTGRMSSHE